MLIVGVDEAGYGPMLGPLVVGGVALRVPDDMAESDVGAALRAALSEAAGDDALRPVLDDSKRVLAAAGGKRRLEHTVLACGGLGQSIRQVGDLARFAVAATPGPWQLVSDAPVGAEATASAAALGLALSTRLRAYDLRDLRLFALVRHACAFNQALEGERSKGDLLFDDHASVFEHLVDASGGDDPVAALFDRHGGRMRYQPQLARYWPQRFAWTEREDRQRSDYRTDFAGRSVRLSFRVKADADAPWVGLASMLAKYLREVAMAHFNAYFARQGCDVRPTAGYVEDARRWLAETTALRADLGVDDSRLVRRR